ncbi:beta-1,6-N-acetylglucosaminyltransferase [Spirosoma sp.]|uniref:beta-1,6-N-acetylglucosaminyltransferase n=1 Tax=Spirosoma sp. TaxID=1899569 RepID=UPI003B3A49B8
MIGGDSTIRIAYLLTVHKNPVQVGRLLKRLYYPGVHFFIHVSASVPLAAFQECTQGVPSEAIHFTRMRMRIRQGDFSLVTATLNGLVDVLSTMPEPDFIFLLSGEDYPLTSGEVLLSFLEKHPDRNFVPHQPVTRPNDEPFVDRLNLYTNPLEADKTDVAQNIYTNRSNPRQTGLIQTGNRLLPASRPVPLNYTPYCGSNWLRIKPAAARYILAFLRQYPIFISYFRNVMAPEMYIYSTILANTSQTALRESLYNDNFTYTAPDRFAEMNAVPFTMSDREVLSGSGKLFARKFDETHDSAILDWLDERATVSLNAE